MIFSPWLDRHFQLETALLARRPAAARFHHGNDGRRSANRYVLRDTAKLPDALVSDKP
jgi:hypothetical protein